MNGLSLVHALSLWPVMDGVGCFTVPGWYQETCEPTKQVEGSTDASSHAKS